GDPLVADEARADLAVAGQELKHAVRSARLVQQPYGGGGDKRRLLRRLGDDGIAGGERGGDLAGEDGEREIPRRDAGEDSPPVQRQRVALAGRAGQRERLGEIRTRPRRVITAEIDRLAQLRERVRHGPAA